MRKWMIAAVLAAAAAPAWAQQCEQTVHGNDAMQFDVKEIKVDKTCKQFTVKLEHSGKLPRNAMGHNWVLTREADFQAVATEGSSAGLDNDYVKPGDARVIAHTKVVGGGESDSVTFDVAKLEAGQNYTFFCSFPGHWAIMKGTLQVQ